MSVLKERPTITPSSVAPNEVGAGVEQGWEDGSTELCEMSGRAVTYQTSGTWVQRVSTWGRAVEPHPSLCAIGDLSERN